MCTSFFIMVWLSGAPDFNRIGTVEINNLLQFFIDNENEKGAQAAKRLAQKPHLAAAAIDKRIKKVSDNKVKERLKALRNRVLERGLVITLYQRSKSGLTYTGQWKDLKQYDPDVGKLLLGIIKEDRMPATIREAAIHALSDLKLTGLVPELKKITSDILNPDWLIEDAGLTMAQLGDHSWLDKKSEALKKLIKESPTDVPRRYSAYKNLARYYYSVGEYKKAIENYEGTISIIEGRLKTLEKTKAEPLRNTLWLTFYNTACSASKGNMLDEAFSYLNKAIKLNSTGQAAKELEKNVQEDGDLDNLRKDARYKTLLKRLNMIYTGKGLKI